MHSFHETHGVATGVAQSCLRPTLLEQFLDFYYPVSHVRL